MACHSEPPFTPEQEARIREIAREEACAPVTVSLALDASEALFERIQRVVAEASATRATRPLVTPEEVDGFLAPTAARDRAAPGGPIDA